MAAYFDEFVDHFGLREKIRFSTEVLRASRSEGGVGRHRRRTPTGEETNRYRAVLVANGHHWDPRWPEPAFPGSEEFEGEQIHVHHYREPDVLAGQAGAGARDRQLGRRRRGRVLADRREDLPRHPPRRLGAAQVHQRQADRRDAQPDHRPARRSRLQRFFTKRALQIAVGEPDDLRPAEARPQAVRGAPDRLLGAAAAARPRRHHRQAQHRPLRRRPHVRFVDGSREEIDLVVYCTGYKITFPFFDPQVFSAPDNRMPLYRRVASVERPGLYFIGFIQPLGPIMPLAEAQCEWVADLLGGRASLPARGGDAAGDRGRGSAPAQALRRL